MHYATDGTTGAVTFVAENAGVIGYFALHVDEDDIAVPDATTTIPGFTLTLTSAGIWTVHAVVQVYSTSGVMPWGTFLSIRVDGVQKTHSWIQGDTDDDLQPGAILYTTPTPLAIGAVLDVTWETGGGPFSGIAKAADRDVLMIQLA